VSHYGLFLRFGFLFLSLSTTFVSLSLSWRWCFSQMRSRNRYLGFLCLFHSTTFVRVMHISCP
jgi:hypothetical protein